MWQNHLFFITVWTTETHSISGHGTMNSLFHPDQQLHTICSIQTTELPTCCCIKDTRGVHFLMYPGHPIRSCFFYIQGTRYLRVTVSMIHVLDAVFRTRDTYLLRVDRETTMMVAMMSASAAVVPTRINSVRPASSFRSTDKSDTA